MAMLKKTITISEELYKETRIVSPNFSTVVQEALETYLHQQRVEFAIKSFGEWDKRSKKSVDIVNKLRKEDTRRNAKSSD